MKQLRDRNRARDFLTVFFNFISSVSNHRGAQTWCLPRGLPGEHEVFLAIMTHCLEAVQCFVDEQAKTNREEATRILERIRDEDFSDEDRLVLNQLMGKLILSLRYGLIGQAESDIVKREVWAPRLGNLDIANAAARTLLRLA